MPTRQQPERVIGWREWIALPDLGIARIKTKVDTGARSSALHAVRIEEFERDGEAMVRFRVHPMQRDASETVVCEYPIHDRRSVRSSAGHEQHRIVIRPRVDVGGEIFEIDLTLTNRDAMGFRMLLGREATRGRFLVDPGASYLTEDDH
jgi:hypothetical protein